MQNGSYIVTQNKYRDARNSEKYSKNRDYGHFWSLFSGKGL